MVRFLMAKNDILERARNRSVKTGGPDLRAMVSDNTQQSYRDVPPVDLLEESTTVCQTNEACKALVPDDGDSPIRPSFVGIMADKEKEQDTAICYTGGFAVKQVHQMCDVTSMSNWSSGASAILIDPVPKRRPQDSRYATGSPTASYFLLQSARLYLQFPILGWRNVGCSFLLTNMARHRLTDLVRSVNLSFVDWTIARSVAKRRSPET